MKKIAVALAALLLGSGAAMADSSFDGLYAGIQGGYGSASADGLGKEQSFSGDAFVGYGATFGKYYLGVEGSAGLDGAEWPTAAGSFKHDWNWGATGRVGYVVTPKVLGYGIAGYERAEGTLDGAKVSQDGLKFGAGVETFVKKNVTARTEVTYTDWKASGAAPAGNDLRTTFGVVARF